jgi:hypothetical protein
LRYVFKGVGRSASADDETAWSAHFLFTETKARAIDIVRSQCPGCTIWDVEHIDDFVPGMAEELVNTRPANRHIKPADGRLHIKPTDGRLRQNKPNLMSTA